MRSGERVWLPRDYEFQNTYKTKITEILKIAFDTMIRGRILNRMAFVKFTQIGGSYIAKISIRTNGQLGFSQGAIKKFSLLEGEWYVIMYYDKDNRRIGILKTRDSKEEGAIRLIRREIKTKDGQSNMNCYVSCKSFFDFNEIKYSKKTESYCPEWDENEGMIVLNLSETKTSNRHNIEEEGQEASIVS